MTYIKVLRNKELGEIERDPSRFDCAQPIDSLGHKNGRFFREHSVVVKDLLSKIAPVGAGPPERFSMTAVTGDCDEKIGGRLRIRRGHHRIE